MAGNSQDQYIIDGILEGNTRVLKELYLDYFLIAKGMILSKGGCEEDAKDIFQDAVVAIFMHARKNKNFLRGRFFSYFFQVVKYIWFRRLKEKVDVSLPGEDMIEHLEDENSGIHKDIEDMEKRKLVKKHIETLGADCQKIIEMTIEGLSLEVIKRQMGYSSIQYTKNRKTTCKNNLIRKVRNSPEFKELQNESLTKNTVIPRW